LNRAPRLLETVSISRSERPEVITLYPLFHLLELSLSFELISGFRDDPIIFWSKARAKFLGAIPQEENCGHSDYSNYNNHEQCNLC
jgi:hypothetical protein